MVSRPRARYRGGDFRQRVQRGRSGRIDNDPADRVMARLAIHVRCLGTAGPGVARVVARDVSFAGQASEAQREERAVILDGREVVAARRPKWSEIGAVLRNRNTWGILLGRSLTDPMWWFFVFWLPQYLSDARGFSLKQIAVFSWLPFVAADIGNFTGGWLSGVSSAGACQ